MRRHRFDILSFVSGLFFAGAGIAYFLNDGRWRFDAGPWVWPVVLLLGGAVVLASTLFDDRRERLAASGTAPVGEEPEAAVPTGVPEIDEIESRDSDL